MPQIELIRPLELGPTGTSELTITNQGSHNVYYGRTATVSVSNKIGTLNVGESLVLTSGSVWVVAEQTPVILDLREGVSVSIPYGVAVLGGDGSIGGTGGSPLAASILRGGNEENPVEVEGSIEPAMPAGISWMAFSYLQKGELTVKPPSTTQKGFIQALIQAKQPAAGGKKLKTTGITWREAEPAWNEAANAVNNIWVFSKNGGASWEGQGPEKGAQGIEGPEGYVSTNIWYPNVKLYETPASSEVETAQAAQESFPRSISGATGFELKSGQPFVGPISGRIGTPIHGIAWYVSIIEGTPANRTHLWAILFNEALEVVARTADFTSSANTPMVATTLHGLRFETPYTPAANEPLHGAVCEVMSSTAPMTLGIREGNASFEATPALCGTLATGQTTPPALKSKVTFTPGLKLPYLAAR
jgi:hypothetical protein